MRNTSLWLLVVFLSCLFFVFIPPPEIAASHSGLARAAKATDMETSTNKSASTFVLRDPDLPISNAFAMIEPDTICSNCLIRLCLVGSGNKLTGYCLVGARGGICHEASNPTRCPPGATPKRQILSQKCGSSGRFSVDALRSCS